MIKKFLFLLLCISSVASAQNSPTVYTEAKPVVVISAAEPTFVIKLKSNPTTGYAWFLRDYNQTLLTPIKHVFEAAKDTKLVGAPGYELWTFRVKPAGFVVPQQTRVRLIYMRPWEVASTPPAEVIFSVAMMSP